MRTRSPKQADKILAAAAQLFATHRFHEARMEDVASLAEVGKGTLYRYFKDKEELYLALLHRAAEGLLSRLTDCIAGIRCYRTQLVRVIEALIAYCDENPHLLDLIQHAEAMQRSDQEFPWQEVRKQTQSLIRGIFQSWEKSGEWRVADPDLAVLMLLGGLRSIYRFGSRPRAEDLAEQIVAGLLGGFVAVSPSSCKSRSRPASSSPAMQVIDAASSSLHNA